MMFCVFFFSSRRRHTRYWRDWSSDVCSSDLVRAFREDGVQVGRHDDRRAAAGALADPEHVALRIDLHVREAVRLEIGRASCRGKSVDLGGRRIIKKKKIKNEINTSGDITLIY